VDVDTFTDEGLERAVANTTDPPARAAATAWFAPFPPPVI
jgi:hypothetical protein